MMYHSITVARRVIRQIIRDRKYLFYSLLFPVLFIWLLRVALEDKAVGKYLDVNWLAVGFTAFLVHIMAFAGCLTVVVRENLDGTMDRMFVFTFRRAEILFGYVIGYSAMVAVQIPIILTAMLFFFGMKVTIAGVAATAVSFFFLGLISIGLALICSNFATSESQALAFIPVIIVPALIFTDMIVPMHGSPLFFQVAGYFTPMKYVLSIVKTMLINQGNPLHILRPSADLIVYMILTLGVGSLAFREKANPGIFNIRPKR